MIIKPLTAVLAAMLLSSCAMAERDTRSGQSQRMGDMKSMEGMNPSRMESMMRGWSTASREAVMFMTEKYGPPAAVSADMAVWGPTGPWKRTVVYAKAVQHNFPMPHPDVMQQWVDFKAPLDKYDELAMYDGSVVLERTTGEISARCDKEPANFLAVNLAHDIVTGKRSVQDARQEYGAQIKAKMAGRAAPLTDRLMFNMNNTSDPDVALPGM
jgi:hypothetical protein